MSGRALLAREVSVPAQGRIDIDGGHALFGYETAGMHLIEPLDPMARYLAELIRYGTNNKADSAGYAFAFPLRSQAAVTQTINLPVSHQGNRFNWVEVANTTAKEQTVSLAFFDHYGTLAAQEQRILAPFSQAHINTNEKLALGEAGQFVATAAGEAALIGQSMFYHLGSEEVQETAGIEALPPWNSVLRGSYNLFLNMENWLQISNPSYREQYVILGIRALSGFRTFVYKLERRASVMLPLHDFSTFSTVPDSYGTIEITPMALDSRLVASLTRLQKQGNTVTLAPVTPLQ